VSHLGDLDIIDGMLNLLLLQLNCHVSNHFGSWSCMHQTRV